MAQKEFLRIDTGGTLERVLQQLGRSTKAIGRAQRRATRKLETYARRQVLRAASQASGASQKTLQSLLRFRSNRIDNDLALSIWVGTNPIKVHHLGKVTWTQRTSSGRYTKGARVGRRLYPGTWSWGRGKTGPAVMQRVTAARLPIEVVTVDVHEAIRTRLDAILPEIAARHQTLLAQELRYALELEARAA